MIVDVKYTVPVYARVDLDTGEVTRVVVYDEGIEQASIYSIDVSESFPYGKPENMPVGEAYEQAQAIADKSDWPAWESGF